MTATQGQRSNVASLDGRRTRVPRRRAETLVADCREMLGEALTEAFPGIMDEIDDALFGLADKAVTDRLQSAYFETMRQIRLERDGLSRVFASELGERVRAQLERGGGRDHESAANGAEPGLTLVENDDLEESLAVDNMARKVRSVCRDELFGLDRRVAALLGNPSIEDESNPLGPEVVCGALGAACKSFEAATEVRLLVMKLFEQRFVRELETVYGELNAHLVRHGVLPDTRSSAAPPSRRAAQRRQEAAENGQVELEPPATARQGQGVGPGGIHGALPGAAADGGAHAGDLVGGDGPETVLDLVRALLAQPSPAAAGALGAGSAAPGEPVPRERMMAGLTALQHGDLAVGGLATRPLAAGELVAGTRNVVRELRDAGVVGAAARDDAVVIDVVAMLFDYVLGDENVCAAVKAQIGRLQIPVLKVAIADHGFFARKGHAVRRYLDALSSLGIGLDERDPAAERVLGHVASSVAGILDAFEDDPAPFGEALEALEAFLARECEEAEANIARAARAAEDAERMQRARAEAGEAIAQRLRGKAVPEIVHAFLDRHWRELLALRRFSGATDDDWVAGLDLVDDLVWSVGPTHDDEQRRLVLDALPYLVARLKSAQRDLGIPKQEAEDFMGALADLHLGAVRGMSAVSPPRAPTPQAPPLGRDEDDAALMREAIEGACRAVHAASLADPSRAGMGTTVVAVLVRDTALTVGHVGDSRLYRLRGGTLDQLTLDHSMVQELMSKMGCTREEASKLAGSNLLTRAIGPDADIVAEVTRIEIEAGDRYLLCSDGLTDLVDDSSIEALLGTQDGFEDIARSLVDAANAAGGRDNISVVLVDPCRSDKPASMLGLSDVGRRRSHNEDCFHVDETHGIAILADGMGGHNAGEVASQMTAAHLARVLEASVAGTAEPQDGHDTMDDFASAFDIDDVEIEEIDAAPPPDVSVEDELTARAQVEALEPGAWVEFERAECRTRARLVRISEQTGRLLFLDRRGLKVADSTPEGLAAEFREGAARALDESPLLERTMNDVAVHLRGALSAA